MEVSNYQEKMLKKPTQCQKILQALQDANGQWVNGRYFLHTLYLSQFHTRIFELQEQGNRIEASIDKDEYGFKSYRLLPKDKLF